MKAINSFIKFTRPHTIIGTSISIFALYAMVCQHSELEHLSVLFLSIFVGLTCNIFIVGINQIVDVELDKINKPYLPLASGEISINQAKTIVYSSMVLSALSALYLSPILFVIVSISMLIGWAYSCPPFSLRKHHLPAALAISLVRGLMVNIGGYLVFNILINKSYAFDLDIIVLSAFIVAFSIVIAWFKDLPDMEGDEQFKIKSLAILYSPRFTLIAGNSLIILAYIFSIYKYAPLLESSHYLILFIGHIVLMVLFTLNLFGLKTLNKQTAKTYYKRFWLFFFAEYILYLFANI
jgi:homogentisate phytyltransferase/homogentisate geranylgeranyltransferase